MGRFGRLDVLVNNAATNPYMGDLLGIDLPRAEKTVRVNQYGMLAWTRCAWDAWMSSHSGVVINMASVGGLIVDPQIGFYNATKAAMLLMTRQLAYELGPKVRVNAIAPGVIKTELARAVWEKREPILVETLPLRRLGTVEDVANAALFLASSASSWMTGQTLVLDGGATALPIAVAD
jgi:NAD(P)-dependent dehydrogenase (short-subunit alcohol dehydrogenase family)